MRERDIESIDKDRRRDRHTERERERKMIKFVQNYKVTKMAN